LLEQDNENLYLTVPYVERERAKKIDGRTYDQEQRRWRYPNTPAALRAIMSEFGAELGVSVPQAIGVVEGAGIAERPSRESLPRADGGAADDADAQANGDGVDAEAALRLSQELVDVRQRLAETEQEAAALRAARDMAEEALARMVAEAAEQKDLIASQKESIARLEKVAAASASQTAVATSRQNGVVRESLVSLLSPVSPSVSDLLAEFDMLGPSRHLCAAMGRQLEWTLQNRHGIKQDKFERMINQAHSLRKLTRDGKGFAHEVRTQRNLATHTQDDELEITFPARALIMLAASTLVFRELEA